MRGRNPVSALRGARARSSVHGACGKSFFPDPEFPRTPLTVNEKMSPISGHSETAGADRRPAAGAAGAEWRVARRIHRAKMDRPTGTEGLTDNRA